MRMEIRTFVASVFAAGLLSGCGRGAAPVPLATPVPAAAPSLEAEIANATAIEGAKSKRWKEALVAADRAVALAPEWPEAYFVRAGIHSGEPSDPASVVPSGLAGTTWTVHEVFDEENGGGKSETTFGFLAGGVFSHPDEEKGRPGTWKLNGASLKIAFGQHWDDGGSFVRRYSGELAADQATMKGTTVYGSEVMGRWTASIVPPVDLEKKASSLEAASNDLEQYLRLKPDADDKSVAIQAIAKLRLDASTARLALAKSTPAASSAAAATTTPPVR